MCSCKVGLSSFCKHFVQLTRNCFLNGKSWNMELAEPYGMTLHLGEYYFSNNLIIFADFGNVDALWLFLTATNFCYI